MPFPYVVEEGDSLAAIARRFGLASWLAIYHDPANAALRLLRRQPGLISRGDVVMIPADDPGLERCLLECRRRFLNSRTGPLHDRVKRLWRCEEKCKGCRPDQGDPGPASARATG
jgi:hypothetical protein